MTHRRISFGRAAAWLVLLSIVDLLVFWPRAAAAQTDAAAYSLEVESEPPSAVDPERLRAMLGSDLGAPVPASGGRVALSVRYRDRKLTVRADHGPGRVLERTIDVDEATAEREASLLASNMARDEARELLDDLAARKSALPGTTIEPEKKSEPAPEPPPPNVYVSVGLLYPLATNFGKPHARSYFDFSLLYGHVGTTDGLQLGSFAAWSGREVNGAQITGFGGITRDLDGAQIGGFGVLARNHAQGFQTAGAFTFAGSIDGAQIAPITIAGNVSGAQIGAINIGRKVSGAQIGVINIADEVDGVQLGVISINRRGIRPIAYATNLAYTNLGLKFSTRWVFTTVVATYGTLDTNFDKFGLTSSVGGHLPLDFLVAGLDVEPEIAFVSVLGRDNNLWLHHRAAVGYSFASHLRVFAGGGARQPLIVSEGRDVWRPEVMAGVQF